MSKEDSATGALATMLTVLGILVALVSGVLAQGHAVVARLDQRLGRVEEQATDLRVRIEHRLTRIETKIDALQRSSGGR